MDVAQTWAEYLCGADGTAGNWGTEWCLPLGKCLEANGAVDCADLHGLVVAELSPAPRAVPLVVPALHPWAPVATSALRVVSISHSACCGHRQLLGVLFAQGMV